jgi:nucleotide-binding universal stress UspA family protein
MFKNIVVGVDESKYGLLAAREAGEVARAMKANNVWIVVAYDRVPVYWPEPYKQGGMDNFFDEGEAATIVDKAQKAMGRIQGKIHTDLPAGSPVDEVLKLAVSRKADLIVMGSHGFGQLTELLHGSPVERVVNRAPCPVLIVH